MCQHAFIKTIKQSYFDKELQCRVLLEENVCIFCGRKEKERSIYIEPQKRKLPKFINNDLSDF